MKQTLLFLITLLALPSGASGQLTISDADRPITVSPEHLFSVGALDGAEWETFGRVRDVAFDAAGNLYVMDSQANRISVFDPQGRYLRHFGREGEGPGEFQRLVAFTVLGDGTSVVTDIRARAMMYFDAEGNYLFQQSLPGADLSAGVLFADPNGGGVFEGGSRARSISIQDGDPGPTGRPINRINADRDGGRTLFYNAWRVPPAGDEPDDLEANGSAGGAIRLSGLGGLLPRVWEPGIYFGPLPDGGMAVVDSTTWKIKLIGPSGRIRSMIERPSLRPTPVTPRIEEEDRAREAAGGETGNIGQFQLGGGAVSGGSAPAGAGQAFSLGPSAYYPEIPVISGLAVSPRGTLWVQRGLTDRSASGPIDLVRWDGRYLGTLAAGGLQAPSAFGPDGLAAWIEADELDVQRVVVRRLPADVR